MGTIKLSNGIEILFHDLHEFSPTILNQVTEFCWLSYNSLNQFFIISKNRELTPTNAREYAKELTQLAAVCDEANELLKQRNNKTQ